MKHAVITLFVIVGLLAGGCRRPIAEESAPGKQSSTSTATESRSSDAQSSTAVPSPSAPPETAVISLPVAPMPADAPDNPADRFLTPEEQADGWICLFDGFSLFGWSSDHPEVNWTVQDGALTADSGPIGLLLTEVPFADFELICEYRMAVGGNSGVFLRTIPDPRSIPGDCHEVNITDAQPNGFFTASLVNEAKTESPILGSGDWQTMRIQADGPRIQIALDGRNVLDFTDNNPASPRSGQIGLQKNSGKIEFRKVVLRPLGLQPLVPPEGLTGWRMVPGAKGTIENDGGEIQVVGGPAFLETEGTYKDFVFQGQSRTHHPGVNSGYFFRAEPGTEKAPSNGYELQIDNTIKSGDRNAPANSGSGAIFRRIEARRVVADDQSWLTATLITSGPVMQVWIDGFPVVVWKDTRPADSNPRKGQRLDAGHISLQGHDPTTEISFRALQIQEIPPRFQP